MAPPEPSLVLGQLSRADGSARLTIGELSVLASVTGPAPVPLRVEDPTTLTLEVNVVPLRGHASPQTQSLALSIRAAVKPMLVGEAHPRTLVQLNLLTLSKPPPPSSSSNNPAKAFVDGREGGKGRSDEDDDDDDDVQAVGGEAPAHSDAEKAALLTAACAALMDAGVQMRGVWAAASLLVITSRPLTEDEEGKGEGGGRGRDWEVVRDLEGSWRRGVRSCHVVGWAFGEGLAGGQGEAMNLVESRGDIHREQLRAVVEESKRAAKETLGFVRKVVSQRYLGPLPASAMDTS